MVGARSQRAALLELHRRPFLCSMDAVTAGSGMQLLMYCMTDTWMALQGAGCCQQQARQQPIEHIVCTACDKTHKVYLWG
jgi:hypothetical protein